MTMRLITYQPNPANRSTFVEFWSARYQYEKENLYDENIGRELTPKRILELFTWKNGTRLSGLKLASVKRNFVARRSELAQLSATENPEQFLKRFNAGGAIWRVFWLHCWCPLRFPIFDQHVHRAMRFIQTEESKEIPTKDPEKVLVYIRDYLPFHSRFAELDARAVDKALWAFGKFIAESNFPLQAVG